MIGQPQLSAKVPEEFVIRVNDFLEAANRIERRLDTAHAQMVLLYAFARYGAHHYFSTVKADSASEREAYASYLGGAVVHMLNEHFADMRGPAPDAAPAADATPDASEPAAE